MEAERAADHVVGTFELVGSRDRSVSVAASRVLKDGATNRSPDGSTLPPATLTPASTHPQTALSSVASSAVQDVLRSPGESLDHGTLTLMEARFGRELSDVRIHHDAIASHSAAELKARAYAVGKHVAFGEGEFSPTTLEGRRLLAHEIAHVIQQNETEPRVQRAPSPADPAAKLFDERIKRINQLLSYGFFDWAITDSEATAAFRLLQAMTPQDRARAFGRVRMDRLLDNIPDKLLPQLQSMIALSGGEQSVLALVFQVPGHQALGLIETLPVDSRDRVLESIPPNGRKRIFGGLSKTGQEKFSRLWHEKEDRKMNRALEAMRPLMRHERFLLRVTLQESGVPVDASNPEGTPVEIDGDGEVYFQTLDIAVSIAGRTRSEAEGRLAASFSGIAHTSLTVQLLNPPAGYDPSSFETKPKIAVPDQPPIKAPPPPDPVYEKKQSYRYFIVSLGNSLHLKYQESLKHPDDEKLQKDLEQDSDAFRAFYDWFDKNENSPKLLKTDPGAIYGQIRGKVMIAAIKKEVKKKVELEEEAKRNSPEIMEARGKKWDEFFNLAMRLRSYSSRRFPYSIPLDSEGADILVTGDPALQAVLDQISAELLGWSREHMMDDNYVSVNPRHILAYILKSGYGNMLNEAQKFPLEHERIDRHELIGDSVFGAFAGAVLKGLTAVAIVGGAVGLGIISGGAAFVILGGLATYSGVTSYIARRKDIEEKGYDVSVPETVLDSLGDIVGVSQTVEGITGERLATHEQLTSVERSEQLGGGMGSIAVLLVGSRAFKFGQGVGQNLRLSGPALTPPTLEGVPREAMENLYKKTTEPVAPKPNLAPGPNEAAARGALPEDIRLGFDRWMELTRSNPRKSVDVESLLNKMKPDQIEIISRKLAKDYEAQLAEHQRVAEAKDRSVGDPLRPRLKHTEWKDGVTIHYEKTPPDPTEIQHGQQIQSRTGEPVHIFGDTPSNQTYPGIDGTIGEPPRPIQFKDVRGPQWLKVNAHDAFQNALKFRYSNVEVYLRIPESTVAEAKAAWDAEPGHPRGAQVGWEPSLSGRGLPLAKVIVEAKDGIWEIPAPLKSPNLPGVPIPSHSDQKAVPVGAHP